jgi:enoyl-CoA hydratase/carnithine racemase
MGAQLKSETQDQTLVLTLSNPSMRNALGPDIYSAGIEALGAAETNPAVRSVVITGEGGTFSAGGNLHRLLANREQDPSVQAASIEGLHTWMETIRTYPKPVIAAVEGAAAGAGFSLALMCDFVVAARDSFFVMAYSNIALSPDGGGSWNLARSLPRPIANEILMLGERITAERLHQLGWINQLTNPGESLAQALQWAQRLNARAPNALTGIKDLLNNAAQMPLSDHLAQEKSSFVTLLHHPNALTGINALLHKQTPDYR